MEHVKPKARVVGFEPTIFWVTDFLSDMFELRVRGVHSDDNFVIELRYVFPAFRQILIGFVDADYFLFVALCCHAKQRF